MPLPAPAIAGKGLHARRPQLIGRGVFPALEVVGFGAVMRHDEHGQSRLPDARQHGLEPEVQIHVARHLRHQRPQLALLGEEVVVGIDQEQCGAPRRIGLHGHGGVPCGASGGPRRQHAAVCVDRLASTCGNARVARAPRAGPVCALSGVHAPGRDIQRMLQCVGHQQPHQCVMEGAVMRPQCRQRGGLVFILHVRVCIEQAHRPREGFSIAPAGCTLGRMDVRTVFRHASRRRGRGFMCVHIPEFALGARIRTPQVVLAASGYHGSGNSPSPRWLNRNARALRQSRRTVRSVTFSTSAISSSLRPPK